MSFMEFIASLGEGYTSVDLGSSSSPPGELANPEILPELDFQKPMNGTPVVQPLTSLPVQSRTVISEFQSVSIQTESENMLISATRPSSLSVTETTIIDAVEVRRSQPNLDTTSTVHVETVRRKAPLMIQRVGRLALEGFSNNTIAPVSANHPPPNRDSFAFDSTDKTELIANSPSLKTPLRSLVSLEPLLIENLSTELTRIMHEEAGVQTIVRLNPSSISIYPKIVVDSLPGPTRHLVQQFETTTPVELESGPDAVDVIAEVLPGVEEFILDTTDPVLIEEADDDSLRLDDPFTERDVEADIYPEENLPEEKEYEEPDIVDQEIEFVEAQLLSDSAGTTVTPSEAEQDHTHQHPTSSAFATFAAVTALVKLQRRIKHRYEQQRTDLINSLGL